jgi:hypothetical protein
MMMKINIMIAVIFILGDNNFSTTIVILMYEIIKHVSISNI